ncbi:MAG: UDP-glucose 4-epimerase GalE [Shewanella vesiculosa]|uniref:UDP-glucose 4-epimerase GalE n=1 Tax=Shewanella vesiculosa TaxID=518738 RepID=UPI0009115D96|nr:UDP-glucose 4-epimerase GalE [Shewanella vesiculosa]NCO14329.1 UDP-glucose 4-epimerase GalE [Thiomicrospira sp.]NCP38809.1 UDP-glucose 4-epimerase GalE [Shewanella vesiculosa]OIP96389.1 MAG: UDP-glucose 4-epimerase GalE [Thiomicrospira sp. CG2_30_44_34]
MRLLVVGGAGYIGSHMVKMLANVGHEVIVLDNLTTGFRESVKYGRLIVGDLADMHLLENLFAEHQFDGVMHFAANSLVGESITNPAKYYRNNVANTLNLLDVMVRNDVKHFIFSSTAATFGEPEYTPIDEAHPQKPINPYGASKLMIERILQDYAQAYGLNSVCLRYFNACGADPEGELGENHDPETHLIPLILQAASGRRKSITVFGRDYATDDGTCIRDYIHINDLCSAHSLALDFLMAKNEKGALAFNLGNGQGFSVQQVIDVVEKVIAEDGFSLTVESGERRMGDPAVLVADAAKAKRMLGWKPVFDDLETIVRHAWRWEKA